MEQFWNHQQLAARNRWTKVDSPGGMIDALLPPFNLSDFAPRMDSVPDVGEHSAALLAELGYDGAQIARFAAAGVVSLSGD
jgi:itaconate CoA-transferase